MDINAAKDCLRSYKTRKPSEIGEAIDVLLKEPKATYKTIAQSFDTLSSSSISSRHKIFLLPKGIRWKVDSGKITLAQAAQICRLDRQEDQWAFAFCIIEKRDVLNGETCKDIGNLVVKERKSLSDALRLRAGIDFASLIRPLMLPLEGKQWLALSQSSWNKHKEPQDFCYELILLSIDTEDNPAKKLRIQ